MRKFKILCMFIFSTFLLTLFCAAQENSIIPDLSEILKGKDWGIFNREVTIKNDKQISVKLAAKSGNGVVWFKNIDFSNGTIEADIKGKDVKGRSFVGIAFRGVDKNTYDAVYFRQEIIQMGHLLI